MFKLEHLTLPFFFYIQDSGREQSKNRKSDKDASHLGGFIFFTQPLARVQFQTRTTLPFIFVFRKAFRSCSNLNTRSTFLLFLIC